MAEKIRVRCSVCGSMPDLDQFVQTEQTKPAPIRVFLQKFGGKVPAEEPGTMPSKKRRRGSAKGYMKYIDIPDDSPAEVAKVKT